MAKNTVKEFEDMDILDENSTVSATDYTGLEPIPPTNSDETSSYSQLYDHSARAKEVKIDGDIE